MLEIDGSEGGGAVVRTAVGLSVATHTPVRLTNIRAARPNPGLQPQHLAGVRAAARLADAELVGDVQGEQTLTFVPNSLRLQDQLRVNIPTAGSVALALQPIQIALLGVDEVVDVVVDGGATAGKWSPPIDYVENVTIPMLGAFGYEQELDVRRHGFYPKGGALVHADIGPANMRPIDLVDRGDITRVEGVSMASEHLRDAEVAERQRKEARRVVANAHPSIDIDITTRYVDARSPGSAITLWARSDTGQVIGADALGEKGKRSEMVGKEAADALIKQLERGAGVDKWLADQLIPVLAVVGGAVSVPRITEHVENNLRVAKRFVDREWRVDRDEGNIAAE